MLSVLLNTKIIDDDMYIEKHWCETPPYNTGMNIKGNNVYSICPGTVLYVGKDLNNIYTVNVSVNMNQIIRYCNLKSVDVTSGDVIDMNDPIGVAHKYVHFEYCTSEKSNWPVRINNIQYYKHNPEGLLDGSTKLKVFDELHFPSSDYYIEVALDEYQSEEFSDNRGE